MTLLILACNSPSEAPPAVQLGLEHPIRPLGVPGWQLRDTIAVRVSDRTGQPRAAEHLTWSIQLGAGSLRVLDTIVRPDGLARAVWTLGPTAGLNRARVAARDDTLSFEVTGTSFQVDWLDSDAGLACGLRGGDLWCWPWPGGADSYSVGPPSPIGTTFPGPYRVSAGRALTTLAVSGGWVCALPSTGVVECYRRSGPDTPVTLALPAMRVLTGSGFATICGLAASDSTPWCWSPGEGDGSVHHYVPSPPLVDLSVDQGASGLVGIACGRRADSTAVCWGQGPVGDSTTQSRTAPVPVAGGLTFAELATGHGFACGRRANSEAWCWGRNTYRNLGTAGGDALTPRLAATNITLIRAAAYTVGVLHGARVARWGQFQFGNPAGNPLTPLAPFAASQVADFAHDDLSCLRLASGEVSCYHELWVFSSTLDIDTYLPVQPVPEQTPVPAGP